MSQAGYLGFAGPGTVGYGIDGRTSNLTTHNGDYVMSANEVLENTYVTGQLTAAAGSVVRNCHIRKRVICQVPAGSVLPLFEFSTFGATSGQEGGDITAEQLRRNFQGAGYTLRRCDVRGHVDGLFPEGDDIHVEDTWIHGLYKMLNDPYQGGNRSHPDCMQVWKGRRITLLRSRIDAFAWCVYNNNTFDQWNTGEWPHPASTFPPVTTGNTRPDNPQPWATTALLVSCSGGGGTGPTSDITVDGCRIAGYTNNALCQFGHAQNSAIPTNLIFRNNVIDHRGNPSDRKLVALVGNSAGTPTWAEWTNNHLVVPGPWGTTELSPERANMNVGNW